MMWHESIAPAQTDNHGEKPDSLAAIGVHTIPFLAILLGLSASACRKPGGESAHLPVVKVETSLVLTPADLGIQKYDYTARPKVDEVALFRVKYTEGSEYEITYDQIMYSPDEKVVKSVMWINRSALAEERKPRKRFEANWSVHAGLFNQEVNDKEFASSSYEANDAHLEVAAPIVGAASFSRGIARGDLRFKSPNADTEDTRFEFEMLVMSYSDAKKIHPKLPEIDKGGTWSSAYQVPAP